MSLITCNNVTLSYDRHDVVSSLTFTVKKNECLCIMGENGSGKSTLVKALLGLKKPRIGKILYGESLKKNEIGYLPQKNDLQKDFPASVMEIVLSGRLGTHRFFSFYNDADRESARVNMERMGITHLAGRSFAELSGGQQQRVLLARALCATSSMLLLDEPSSALDAAVTSELYSLIGQIREAGITVVMVSHDIENAVKCADRILCLSTNGWYICQANDFHPGNSCRADQSSDSEYYHECDKKINDAECHVKGDTENE